MAKPITEYTFERYPQKKGGFERNILKELKKLVAENKALKQEIEEIKDALP